MRKAIVATILATCAGIAVVMIGANFLALGSSASPPVPVCPAVSPVKVGQIVVPAGPVAGYCQNQLINAAHIMNAARALDIGTHTQAVGVMTAMGESGLRVLNHGDAAGVDSRGLFQQRDNGAWGTLADRMDPFISATNFFTTLTGLDGWKTMTPSAAAHAVQVNADANYYTAYWERAQTIVTELGK